MYIHETLSLGVTQLKMPLPFKDSETTLVVSQFLFKQKTESLLLVPAKNDYKQGLFTGGFCPDTTRSNHK